MYIGPFFRSNSTNKDNIKNQLFHLSKEAIKDIVFNSKCGITFPLKDIKTKDISLNDISTFKSFSPLICIYKKSSCNLYTLDKKLSWDDSSYRKNIIISSNAYMTLCLMELSNYFLKFKSTYPKKFYLNPIYISTAKKQIDFYTSYLRNSEGVFIDKKDISNGLTSEIKLEAKGKDFKFSDQALLMCAHYKFSTLYTGKNSSEYKNFSFDILKMLLHFKDDLYNLSSRELNKLILALNIFFDYSKNIKAYELLIDLFEFTCENHIINYSGNITNSCLLCLNSILLYKSSKLTKFKDTALKMYSLLQDLFIPEDGMFFKQGEKKECTFYSTEIILYLINSILICDLCDDPKEYDSIIEDVFKHQLIESGIIASWPAVPSLDNPERYKNFSLKAEDLIDENNFKMSSMPTPELSQIAPIFFKKINFNKKKRTFSDTKQSFYSDNNMFIFFIIIYCFKHFFDF
ncbi:hypothetical protein [Clostridium guangxiense]|uniref:hypothetical protein n=1 Tax=Clostridium guangxiense TaxID=1662055 RepID=UPI001E38EE12|nr:hypothetical protein [Clostridium guangxiense]MCD2347745.1 hypothetical protein [Clostridium guangxiense]